jgi:hypothetical protein
LQEHLLSITSDLRITEVFISRHLGPGELIRNPQQVKHDDSPLSCSCIFVKNAIFITHGIRLVF